MYHLYHVRYCNYVLLLQELKKYQEEELNRVDMKIILELDQVVSVLNFVPL